ncbi:MAG: hypothetical protein LBK23_02420 [Oscillospiraceae bacterium]|jgi:hypothetical protein|nr:hypothetical protein [Oscillospiraceae bacterium]
MKKKIIATILVICLAAALLTACGGGGGDLPDLSGTYECSDYGFDISALTFSSDGTVGLSMDWEYNGTYKKSGKQYVLSITDGKSAVSDVLAKEREKAYKITVTPDSDDTLTVHIKAKSGYIYYGKESAVFKKK